METDRLATTGNVLKTVSVWFDIDGSATGRYGE
jgi:hypothetical protein